MLRYSTYSCDTCKRTKDLLADSTHYQLNYCIITKGCAGRMSKVGETNISQNTPVVAGLQDWYPRGQELSSTPLQKSIEYVGLSCAANGTITLAIQHTDADALTEERSELTVKFLQRRVEPISFQKYIYKLESTTDEVFGRDTTGKNLRVDAQAKADGRVSVKVNGVDHPNFTVPQVNRIKLESQYDANTIVTVVVAAEKDTVERNLKFIRHSTQASTVNFGAWDNVRFVKTVDASGEDDPNSWWVYSCNDLTSISSSTSLQVDSIWDKNGTKIVSGEQLKQTRFLLASTPFTNVDRYMNFVVSLFDLSQGFVISSPVASTKQLQVERKTVTEIFPSMRMKLPVGNVYSDSSFIQEDTIVASSSSQITTDSAVSRLKGRKVIGPV